MNVRAKILEQRKKHPDSRIACCRLNFDFPIYSWKSSNNYSKINKLTTVEAISAALFILGFDEDAKQLLEKFKWGHTFYDLNKNLLDDYSKLQTEEEIPLLLEEYGLIIDSDE